MRKNTFEELVHNRVSNNNPEKQLLAENGFLIEQPIELFVKENAPWLRSMKEYCLGGTSLHIFAVTNNASDCPDELFSMSDEEKKSIYRTIVVGSEECPHPIHAMNLLSDVCHKLKEL